MIGIVLAGAAGRMGRAVEQAAAGLGDVEIVARIDRRENFGAGDGGWTEDAAAAVRPGCVVLDVSAPALAAEV